MAFRKLTAEEVAELTAWIKVEGRNWRLNLINESWMRGLPARDRKGGREYGTLYAIRNDPRLGQEWLNSRKAVAMADAVKATGTIPEELL